MSKAMLHTISGITGTARDLAARCGVELPAMRNRLYLHRLGRLAEDQVLLPGTSEQDGGGNAEWRALSDRSRPGNLRMIPEPTNLERNL